jgi:hypothetical protein
LPEPSIIHEEKSMIEIETEGTQTASIVRLLSTPGVNTAGLLAWAKAGYTAERKSGRPVGPFIAVFAEGYGLGAVVAERVLRGETDLLVDGEEVELHLNSEETRLFKTCGQAANRDPKTTVQVR